jgi:hypothetical protein
MPPSSTCAALQKDKLLGLQQQVEKLEKHLADRDEMAQDSNGKIDDLQESLAAAEEEHMGKERAWRKERAMILQV